MSNNHAARISEIVSRWPEWKRSFTLTPFSKPNKRDDEIIDCPTCDGTRRLRVFSEEQREYPCNSCMATGQMTRKEARELRLVPSVIED